ncbi:hypothetical protein [Geomicrobium sp. JCM 19038]|uniref:hypothetical protein n=1 Tax=Geomicrobium sp. JCM 19038 TaxID=1460635 RepID=UPI00045F1C87|nr:hypothetical protein [Geomicrobium sp. JCM 19038]GAK08234.1 hypothetical protein JCM19038_2009 [Geomicrobium sp. JCM 19038]
MRFKPKDVIITLLLIATTLTFLVIISASLTSILFGQSERTAVMTVGVIAFITLIFSYIFIDRIMLRRNNQGWQALGFRKISLRKSSHLLWQIPVFYLFSLLAQGMIMVIYHAFFPISLTNLEGTTNSLHVDASIFQSSSF